MSEIEKQELLRQNQYLLFLASSWAVQCLAAEERVQELESSLAIARSTRKEKIQAWITQILQEG